MSHINLDYINASQLAQDIARCKNLQDLREMLIGHIQDDLGAAGGYIRKYDNQWDKAETNVEDLKKEVEQINKILSLLGD